VQGEIARCLYRRGGLQRRDSRRQPKPPCAAFEAEIPVPDAYRDFRPPFGLRSGHVQSLIASSFIRRRAVLGRSAALQQAPEVWTLDGGDGVRLQGLYSAQPGASRGLAVLLHGWEGSVNSNYMLANGARLFAEGFDVFRLNFRDHGDTHHLNPGLFHSCRIDEVVNSLGELQRRLDSPRWCLAGYSLRRNFPCAWRCGRTLRVCASRAWSRSAR
jgi:predicted alpha/beta-fold hydrolase